jgi:hypothetical protein
MSAEGEEDLLDVADQEIGCLQGENVAGAIEPTLVLDAVFGVDQAPEWAAIAGA